MKELYICPKCKSDLPDELVENSERKKSIICPHCNYYMAAQNNSIDFVTRNDAFARERDHYDNIYKSRLSPKNRKLLHFDQLNSWWNDSLFPYRQDILKKLGNIQGKTILLLGNGESTRELIFLWRGANLIFSDLSFIGIITIAHEYDFEQYASRVRFHAINALDLPFRNESIDIVYGYAFVHHLSEPQNFLIGVKRILKPGGLCLFFDDAYSPIWQFAKRTFMKPLMRYTHSKHGISPEDLRATTRGGFKEEEIKTFEREVGFKDCFFIRRCFLAYFWTRMLEKVFSCEQTHSSLYRRSLTFVNFCDSLLFRMLRFSKRNAIRLVWGFHNL